MAIYDKHFNGYRIFVGDLGQQATRGDVEQEFERYGPLLDVWVARDPPGFAFLVFKYAEDCEKAVRRCHGHIVCGRRVRVQHARPFNDRRPSRRVQAGYRNRWRSQSYYRQRYRSHSRDRRRTWRSHSRSSSSDKKSAYKTRDQWRHSEEKEDSKLPVKNISPKRNSSNGEGSSCFKTNSDDIDTAARD